MCNGVQLAALQSRSSDKFTAAGGGAGQLPCELCGSRASIYCQADDAYLCRKCDMSVHGANLLALRHVRCLLCSTCQSHTRRYLLGASMEILVTSIVRRSVEGNYRDYPCDRDDDFDEDCSFKTRCLFL